MNWGLELFGQRCFVKISAMGTWLDFGLMFGDLHLDVGLREGLDKQIGKLVWFDGQASTREAMLDAISHIGASYRRMVVVLQPHVTRSRLSEVRQALESGVAHRDQGRVRQLDTLLLGAQASCRSLSAELWVLADQI